MEKSFYIYGAGIVATSIYHAIEKLYNLTPKAFLVSNKEGNPSRIGGVPVLALSEIEVADNNIQYLIATPEIHHVAIADSLRQLGIGEEQLVFVDNHLENTLMRAYYCSLQEFTTISELLQDNEKDGVVTVEQGITNQDSTKQDMTEQNNTEQDSMMRDIAVYQAKCHVDKPLQNNLPIPEYVQPIQVGASLTDEVIAEIRDNVGKNISHKNGNYCELTATYYAWKNSQVQYKGLCHYRRIFDVSEKQMQTLLSKYEDVDVILPYPSIHYPDISGQHKRYVSEGDWNAMLQAMEEVAPEYYATYIAALSKGRFFYNYNMLIAKREVFDDYCRFLFSVLERTEELTTPKGWERADRFAGYLGENLTTLYFRKNRDKLKIVHAGKLWLT